MYIKLATEVTSANAGQDAAGGVNRRSWSIGLSVAIFFLLAVVGACTTLADRASDLDAAFDATAHGDAAPTTIDTLLGLAGRIPDERPALRSGSEAGDAHYVILISVDGLRPDAVTRQSAEKLPNFYRLRAEGAFTDNARTDVDKINTLPNHIAQLTGRPVMGDQGHNWTSNGDPGDATIHERKGEYVASVFDVVHGSGLRASAYVSKSKLALFDQSYDGHSADAEYGAADSLNGEIERFVFDSDSEDLVRKLVLDLKSDPTAFSFLHLRDPDSKGHVWSWSLRSWSPYMRAVRRVDRMLGRILDTIDADPRLAGNTIVILTSDHGGKGWGHGSKTRPEDYTIPFYVWGAGVADVDLYDINLASRRDPGRAHPGFDAEGQPIRNGDAANLAVSLLGLAPVPGSIVNAAADLNVRVPFEHYAAGGE